jgi:hypothetical protein
MKDNPYRTCVFQERCPRMANFPRALWPSPLHEQYYIPTVLPRQPAQKPSSAPHQLCIVGSTNRRSWGLLRSFLDGSVTRAWRFQLQILGFGEYPEALEDYRDLIRMSSPVDYREFHRLAAQCDGILMLVTKSSHVNYFATPESLLKLSGTLPIVLAYQIPVILHEELYQLYKDHLPSNVTIATHTDDVDSFVAAMKDFLDQLDQQAPPS